MGYPARVFETFHLGLIPQNYFQSARRCWRALTPLLGISLLVVVTGCSGMGRGAKWPEGAQKWYDRAELSYREGQLDDATLASEKAFQLHPEEPSVRLLAAQVAMANLQFEKALEYLTPMLSSEAASLRARCYWYLGNIERTADEIDQLSQDPEYRDPWATEIAGLARSGRGRRPFETMGGLLAVMEMPHAGSTAFIVPVEVNGEPSLAVIATDSAETVIDSKDGEGSWISLRFGGRVEVADVPAVGRDLAGISKQIGAPVKILIGVHLLRQLHPTIDFAGHQFVVRTFEPPAPPQATTITPAYYRGGAMVMSAKFGVDQESPQGSLYVNTSMRFPLALDEDGWKKAGQNVSELTAVPGAKDLSQGVVPRLQMGAYDVSNIPAVFGVPVAELEKRLKVNLDGAAGSGLLSTYRLTLVGRGRTLWIEDFPMEALAAFTADSASAPGAMELSEPDLLDGSNEPTTAPVAEPPAAGPSE